MTTTNMAPDFANLLRYLGGADHLKISWAALGPECSECQGFGCQLCHGVGRISASRGSAPAAVRSLSTVKFSRAGLRTAARGRFQVRHSYVKRSRRWEWVIFEVATGAAAVVSGTTADAIAAINGWA